MTSNLLPRPCEGCEFDVGLCMDITDKAQPLFSIVEGGVLISEPTECGSAVRKVLDADQLSDFPDLVERLRQCQGPAVEMVEAPRKWPLGALGLTKTVELKKCSATTPQDIGEIVAAAQEKRRLEGIYDR